MLQQPLARRVAGAARYAAAGEALPGALPLSSMAFAHQAYDCRSIVFQPMERQMPGRARGPARPHVSGCVVREGWIRSGKCVFARYGHLVWARLCYCTASAREQLHCRLRLSIVWHSIAASLRCDFRHRCGDAAASTDIALAAHCCTAAQTAARAPRRGLSSARRRSAATPSLPHGQRQ